MNDSDVRQYAGGSLDNFVYLIVSQDEALVVDPQADLTVWEEELERRAARLKGCLLTHTHGDHVEGLPAVTYRYGVPIWVHEAERKRLQHLSPDIRQKLCCVRGGDSLSVGALQVEILHTPGHSRGACSYLVKGLQPWRLLTGDTIFVGDVGRCDLPTGSVEQMFASIQRIKLLPPDTVILPGHDYGEEPTSTVERELRTSAAFRCRSVAELDALP
ncbi:MAG: MBL fold metallo-hydrolase [Planctomycetota bacterium]